MKKLIIGQFVVLLLGVVFAWFNFTRELLAWLNNSQNQLTCASGAANPFLTPCFYGALFFTLAFILSLIMVLKSRKPLQKK